MSGLHAKRGVRGLAGRVQDHHVGVGIALSLLAHAGFGGAILRVEINGSSASTTQVWQGSASDLGMRFEWKEAPGPELTPEPPMLPSPALARQPEPAPEPIRETPPEPKPKPREIVLGVDGSTSKTENWLGFADPTEHSARKSVVEQPALDLVSGRPGAPGAAAAPAPVPEPPPVLVETPAPPAMESSIAPAPEPSATPRRDEKQDAQDRTEALSREPETARAKPEADVTREPRESTAERNEPAAQSIMAGATPETAAPEPRDIGPLQEPVKERLARAGEATAELNASASASAPLPALPELPDGVVPATPGAPRGGTVGERAAVEPKRAQAPERVSEAQLLTLTAQRPVMLNAQRLERLVEAARRAAATAAASPKVRPIPAPAQAGGDGAERLAEASDAESDASSLEEPVQVRLGRPAAAEGIQIVTRRPSFTLLTRVTAVPRNPVLAVWFDRSGTVVDVQVLESSGVRDVDEPVVNATYQWLGKGERFEKMTAAAPDARLKIVVEIVLQ